jgi:enamidase
MTEADQADQTARYAACTSARKRRTSTSRLSASTASVSASALTSTAVARASLVAGLLAAGKAADIVLLDAPDGGTQHDALSAIRNGDIAAVGAVITAGEPRFVGRSRNTPATTRNIRVASCKVMRDFSARH